MFRRIFRKNLQKIYSNSRDKLKPSRYFTKKEKKTLNFAVIIKRTYKLALFFKISRSSI